jgi:hypothetical protein
VNQLREIGNVRVNEPFQEILQKNGVELGGIDVSKASLFKPLHVLLFDRILVEPFVRDVLRVQFCGMGGFSAFDKPTVVEAKTKSIH